VQFDTERKEQENRVLLIESTHRGEALKSAKKLNDLQWMVIALGSALLMLLAVLVIRQVHKTRRMRILAMTDELTKLPNRRHILTFLGDQAKISYESEQPISVIVFDIDHFKTVNDKYGHDGGDIALKTVANIGHQALRRGDRVGRIGGEEFLVVLPGTEHKSAMEIAERLRRSVEVTEFDKLLSGLRLTISLGVSEWNAGHESIDALVKRADIALYEAKTGGRNRVVEK
ncbi:MAG: GGDEF domain-containing protein, partial [Methylococcales bacterium]